MKLTFLMNRHQKQFVRDNQNALIFLMRDLSIDCGYASVDLIAIMDLVQVNRLWSLITPSPGSDD
jgi:hypothetical protein